MLKLQKLKWVHWLIVWGYPHSLASVEKLKALLGYEPTHTIDQGLKLVLGKPRLVKELIKD